MNKKKTFKKVTSIASLGIISATIGIAATSCGSSEPAPYDYVGNETGTDWKGYRDGNVQTSFNDDNTCSIGAGSSYEAKDLIIPKYIEKKEDGKQYEVVEISYDAFASNQKLIGNLTIPDSVETIGAQAFYGCSGFKDDLIIPNSVTSIGWGAFYGCLGFTGQLKIPDSVTSIGYEAFRNCSKFNKLNIGEKVNTIEYQAFENCVGFTGELVIPDSVTEIGHRAFHSCPNLTSITISSNTTKIDYLAFSECQELISITLKGSGFIAEQPPSSWASDAFKAIQNNETGYVHVKDTNINTNQAFDSLNACGLMEDGDSWEPYI